MYITQGKLELYHYISYHKTIINSAARGETTLGIGVANIFSLNKVLFYSAWLVDSLIKLVEQFSIILKMQKINNHNKSSMTAEISGDRSTQNCSNNTTYRFREFYTLWEEVEPQDGQQLKTQHKKQCWEDMVLHGRMISRKDLAGIMKSARRPLF